MIKSRTTRAGLASAGAALLASAALAVAAPAGAAAAGCSVNYAVSSQWPGGFGARVTITNLGDPLTSWTLTWSFGAGQTVTQAWNTSLTQSDSAVSASNVSYRNAGQCSGLQTGGEGPRWGGRQGPSSALTWTVLLLDVLLHDARWRAADGAGEVRARPESLLARW